MLYSPFWWFQTSPFLPMQTEFPFGGVFSGGSLGRVTPKECQVVLAAIEQERKRSWNPTTMAPLGQVAPAVAQGLWATSWCQLKLGSPPKQVEY